MSRILWVLINCNSSVEAGRIGRAMLKKRLAACYDIFPRQKTAYFWPPRSGKITTGKGALLVLETLPAKQTAIRQLVVKLHSDQLPFIGSLAIAVDRQYQRWVGQEITKS